MTSPLTATLASVTGSTVMSADAGLAFCPMQCSAIRIVCGPMASLVHQPLSAPRMMRTSCMARWLRSLGVSAGVAAMAIVPNSNAIRNRKRRTANLPGLGCGHSVWPVEHYLLDFGLAEETVHTADCGNGWGILDVGQHGEQLGLIVTEELVRERVEQAADQAGLVAVVH